MDVFPLTPDSKCSGGAYYHIADTSPGSEWGHVKHPGLNHAKNHPDSSHPFRPPPCFQDAHTFDNLVGRPACDNNNQSQPSDSNVGTSDFQMCTRLIICIKFQSNEIFLKHLDGLSPASCRFIVHYKEAVRERQRMRLFTTYWELEETNRLRTLLMSLYAEENSEFRRAEQETEELLKALITKQSPSRVAADVDFLTAVRQQNKTSLRETDARLDLLKDRVTQIGMHPFRSSTDGLNNTCRSSPMIATDA